MIGLGELQDAQRRTGEAVTARGGGTEGILAWANAAGIDAIDWVRFLRNLRTEHIHMAPAPASAFLIHGLRRDEFAEGLSLTLDALAAHAFQTGWIAATLHAELAAVES